MGSGVFQVFTCGNGLVQSQPGGAVQRLLNIPTPPRVPALSLRAAFFSKLMKRSSEIRAFRSPDGLFSVTPELFPPPADDASRIRDVWKLLRSCFSWPIRPDASPPLRACGSHQERVFVERGASRQTEHRLRVGGRAGVGSTCDSSDECARRRGSKASAGM